MKSIWTQTTEIPRHQSLSGNKKAEVAVIGGGMAGILTAYFLQKQGKKVIVLEADRIGSGQTGGTTAKITSQHGLIYTRLRDTIGHQTALLYARANEEALSQYRRTIKEEGLSCHFTELPSYLYSTIVREPIKQEAEYAGSLGLPAEFVTETELPFPVRGAVRFQNQAYFHPLEFIRDLSSCLTIYEHTKVKTVNGNLIETEYGAVTAEHIVFACHYPFINFPGLYFARMYQDRSYVLALDGGPKLDGMYLSADSDASSFRNYGKYMLMGYGDYKTGTLPGKKPYSHLEKTAKIYWPQSSPKYGWSAQDCMTLDHLPYIGRFSPSRPEWYVATGFQKWGMTNSMVSAVLLTDLISGKKNPYEQIYSPRRFHLKASVKRLAEHGGRSSKGLLMGLAPNAPRCPHLGCRLTWNPADKSWDCPCHGSRFEQSGKILNGPAQEDLSFID